MRYPESLIRRLLDIGAARVHAVSREGRVVASLLTLVTGSHWMCWLAGQTEEGRAIAASYLAYDALFAEACSSGVAAVNLGASVGGGSEFKRHLGATDVTMCQWVHESVPAAAARFARHVARGAISSARGVHETT
jgi:CelD/BcsL family acetyltransferase involved in cellulose biosynthesis